MQEILEEAAKKTNAAKGSDEQKIGDYYASCLDEAKREAEGMKPLVPELARIDRIQDLKGVQAEIAYCTGTVSLRFSATARCRT